jgi:peptide/nickel transport system ATP-binding protein
VAALLDVKGLTVEFQGDRGTRKVLDRVDLQVQDGETLGIVGESGSGKSVLLTAVMGLLQPPWRINGGQVLLQGRELLDLGERELGTIRGKELGLALANPRQHLNPILPIGRQLTDVLRTHRPQRLGEAVERAADLLSSVGIPDPVTRLQAFPHELSGGMCQRVILALAIAHAPRLLMVDEPTSGLDVTISAQILDLLRDAVRTLHSGLIVVSRDLAIVAHYCQRVLVMRAGRVIEDAPVHRFFA